MMSPNPLAFICNATTPPIPTSLYHIHWFADRMDKLKDRVSMDTIRPLPMFLGITGPSMCLSPEAFNPPSHKLDKYTFEKIKNRLALNGSFFLSNYALLTAGTCIVVSLMNTEMILYVALISTFWWFHTFTLKNNIPISIAGRNLDDMISVKARSTTLLVATVLVIVFYCLIPFMSMMAISIFLILTHAMLRDPKHIESASMHMFRGAENGDNVGMDDDDDDSGEEVLVNKGDVC